MAALLIRSTNLPYSVTLVKWNGPQADQGTAKEYLCIVKNIYASIRDLL